MQRIYRIKGVIQPYAWGGSQFIPSLTGIDHKGPAAEYWLGTHPLAPSQVEGGKGLQELIRENKQDFLGKYSEESDSLPFLLKVLDVKDMLSIQVHPNKKQAAEGFQNENARGIPLNASNRNYKDPNQKAEMMMALSEFWLLRGFKIENELRQVFLIPELSSLEKEFNEGGYEQMFTSLMRMEQAAVNDMLRSLTERVMLLYNEDRLQKSDPDYWAARAHQTYFTDGNIDRGIACIYLLNLVHLKKGEVVDQLPGDLHAYLEGQNIEVMTNSDNVLRAGLTPKHVDVEELLKLVSFKPLTKAPQMQKGSTVYQSEEFIVDHFSSEFPDHLLTGAPAILLVLNGSMRANSGDQSYKLEKGQSVFILPYSNIEIFSSTDVEFLVVSAPKKDL